MNKNALELVLGRYDDPENQTQKHYTYDLYGSNLAIFGLAASGKTTLLKTLLIRLHQVAQVTRKERVYILDFSNNLEPYRHLPYTVAYFDASQEENVRRIFNAVEERFTHNVSRLPGLSFRQCAPDYDRPSHVTFLLDGLSAFMTETRYAMYQETLLKLARDGLTKGVSVIVTASDLASGITKLLPSFGSIITLDFPPDQYADLYHTKTEKPIKSPGRGLANHGRKVYEFQAYFPYNADAPGMNDQTFIRQLEEQLRKCPPPEGDPQSTEDILRICTQRRMKVFTGPLTRELWKSYTGISWAEYLASPVHELSDLVVGLNYYNFTPVKFNLLTARSIAIYGRRAFGKTNLLSLILEQLQNIPNLHFVIWEDGRKGLSRNASTVQRILDAADKEGRLQMCTDRWQFEAYMQEHYPGEFTAAVSRRSNPDAGAGTGSLPGGLPPPLPPDQMNQDRAAAAEALQKAAEALQSTAEAPIAETHPFTVFLIQSRLFYQTEGTWRTAAPLIQRMASFANACTEGSERLFLFSDAQPILDSECAMAFNSCVAHAFLLNNILQFINDRGQKSMFSKLDKEELKERFGKCDLGDGFYYDLEGEEIQKVRFLKQPELVDESEGTIDGNL